MSVSHYLERYIFLKKCIREGMDTAVEKKILIELDKLWYYYLTPLDKEMLEQK